MEFLHDTNNNDEHKHFIWSHTDAFSISTNQIGQSACGATAIVNACQALNIVVPPKAANNAIGTRLRNYDGSLIDYLKSRSNAGATHEDFVRCLTALQQDHVVPEDLDFKFYSYLELMIGQPMEYFSEFCMGHLKTNGSLILTMNLQKDPVKQGMYGWVADAWHHQTIYGIDTSKQSFYLTNPLEMKELSSVHRVLHSASDLLIREDDLRKFITVDASSATRESLEGIAAALDDISPEWKRLNVGANFLNLMTTAAAPSTSGGNAGEGEGEGEGERSVLRRYLTIPAAYTAGVTVIRRGNAENNRGSCES